MTREFITLRELFGSLSYYAEYDSNYQSACVWRRSERCILTANIQPAQGQSYSYLQVNGVLYYTDPAGHVDIDLTDIVKAYKQEQFELDIIAGDGERTESVTIQLVLKDGLSYENQLLPQSPMAAGMELADYYVIPPTKIYTYPQNAVRAASAVGLTVEVASRHHRSYEYEITYSDGTTSQGSTGVGELPLTGSGSNRVTALRISFGGADWGMWQLCEVPQCARYCIVKWKSRNGNFRKAIWIVKSNTIATGDEVKLQSTYNGYKSLKGETVTLQLAIDDLCAYDYAYYMDVVTSSEVYVLANMADGDELGRQYTRATVATKQYIVQGDGQRYSAEITINLKQYEIAD